MRYTPAISETELLVKHHQDDELRSTTTHEQTHPFAYQKTHNRSQIHNKCSTYIDLVVVVVKTNIAGSRNVLGRGSADCQHWLYVKLHIDRLDECS